MRPATRMGWIGAVAALLAGTGCTEIPADAAARIRQADQSYRQSDYANTERYASAVIDAHPQHPATAEAYYLRGLARLKSGDRVAARGDFHDSLRLSGRKDLGAKIHGQLGHLFFDEGRYQRALEHFRKSASVGWDEAVFYRWGIAALRSGRFAEARRALTTLLEKSPGGVYAESARQKMRWKHQYFSVQCGAYSTSERAYSAAATLRSNNANIAVVRDVGQRHPKYIVLAGRYRDFPSAENALRRIKPVVPDAFLVP